MRWTQRWLAGARVNARQFVARAGQILATEPGQGPDEGIQARALESASQARKLRGGVAKLSQLDGYWEPFELEPGAREALASLWDQMEPADTEDIRRTIREDLGDEPETLFSGWSDAPFAAASLGQVHAAAGERGELAIKVQYPDIDEALRDDVASRARLRELAGPALGPALDDAALDALQQALLRELDYRAEAEVLEAFGKAFADEPCIAVPAVIRERSTARVLTMTRLAGSPLRALTSADPAARNAAATTILRFAWLGPLRHGLVHADPNPGNFLVDPARPAHVGFVDFGCAEILDDADRQAERRLWSSLFDDDIFRGAEQFRQTLLEVGVATSVRALHRQSYRQWETLVTKPFRSSEPFVFDLAYAQELLQASRNVCGTGVLRLPRKHALLWRQRLGTVACLALLDARVEARAVLREAIDDAAYRRPLSGATP